MYHPTAVLVAVLAFVPGSLRLLAEELEVLSSDLRYSDPTLPLDGLACSDSLKTRSRTTLGSLPQFPNIGTAPGLDDGNSPQCGACYNITYKRTGTTISVYIVDLQKEASEGFAVSEQAKESLTGIQPKEPRPTVVYVERVSSSNCGLPAST